MRPTPPPPSGGWDQLPDILAHIVPPQFAERDFVVTDYGAVSDGKTDCYPAFAAAIAACSKAGGGRVVVPGSGGVYRLNGPIHLRSNVNLYLEAGSEVRFGSNPSDYLPVVQVRYQGIRCYNYSPLIYAYQQSNIAITGTGVLDGQAYEWDAWQQLAGPDFKLLQQMVAQGVPVEKRVFGAGHHLRLTMFEPYDCKNLLVQDVTFRGSPFWTLHPTFCTNVTIQNVTVEPGQSNDDGFDPDSCANVLAEGCTFTTNDDNISIKAGAGEDAIGLPPCENIVIQNCHAVSTEWGGITIGSQTGSIVQSVFVQNCQVGKCDDAIFIKSNSAIGGAVKNVFIRSCKVSHCNIFLDLDSAEYGASGPTPPLYSNIKLENVSCDRADGFAFAMLGNAANPIQFVSLTDVAVGSAGATQQISNALYITSSNVTVGGKQITVE
jgi:polygalacturonase